MRDADGVLAPGAGTLSPHVTVEQGNRHGRFDDLIGTGFVVIMRDTVTALSPARQAALDAIGAHVAVIGEAGWRDLDGRLTGFMNAQGWGAFIVRPDFYIYGGGTGGQLPNIVDSLLADLERAGVNISARHIGEFA